MEQQQTTQQRMGLLHMKVKDFGGLYEVDLPIGPVETIIGGQNEQGKTAFLTAINVVLGGARAAPRMPVREGAEEAVIVGRIHDAKLGDLIIRHRFTASGRSECVVETAEGATFRSPREKIKALFGETLKFDPEAWAAKGKTPAGQREQRDELLQLLGVDFTKSDADYVRITGQRMLVKRDLATIQSQLRQSPQEDAPAKPVSVEALLGELEKAQEHNKSQEKLEETIKALDGQIVGHSTSIQRAQHAIQQWQTVIDNTGKALEETRRWREERKVALDEFQPVSTIAIQQRIAAADSVNRLVHQNEMREQLLGKQAVATASVRELTAQLDAIQKHKAKIVSEADFPIPGLGFSEDGVTHNGIDLATGCSGEERLRIATAVILAQLKKDGVRNRVLTIEEGCRMDAKHRDMVRQMCRDAGAQVIIEVVSSEGDIILEDGRLKGDSAQEAPAAQEPPEAPAPPVDAAVADEWLGEAGVAAGTGAQA